MRRTILLLVLLLSVAAVFALRFLEHRDLYDQLLRDTIPARDDQARYQALVDKLGSPPLYSKRAEELIIRDWFEDRRGGYFLDVGANHHRINSNTYYLERHLGWSGIAVDAIADYERGYVEHRPATRYFTFFVSDQSDELATFFVIQANKRLSSGEQRVAKNWAHQEIEVPTITLTDLLDHAEVSSIDLLSMDIELWEPRALAGFDIERFAPQLVCIEAHTGVQDALTTYFAEHGYERIEKYLEYDVDNWYFRPKS